MGFSRQEYWTGVQRIDTFEVSCWRRLLGVPWSARRSILGVYLNDWCWSWNSNTLATGCEELTDLKRPWCWERLKAQGEGHDRGWDDWMASPTQLGWVWVNSGSWCWTGKPGVQEAMGLQNVGHDWADELLSPYSSLILCQQLYLNLLSIIEVKLPHNKNMLSNKYHLIYLMFYILFKKKIPLIQSSKCKLTQAWYI